VRKRPPWAPPPPDPPAGLTEKDPREWMRVWLRVMAPRLSVKTVGFACAAFADYKSGGDIWAGIPLFQAVTGLSNKPVGDALALMRDWGLLWRYYEAAKSGIEGDADCHRLTFPDDISGIPMLSPDWVPPALAACG
jgi:hypothetical protein